MNANLALFHRIVTYQKTQTIPKSQNPTPKFFGCVLVLVHNGCFESSWTKVEAYFSVILKATSLIFFLFEREKSELQ